MALFGKLPAHGDFVRRGEAALVRRLDAWLTGQVEQLALAYGDDYQARLQALPAWSFLSAEGFGGALVGSRDRVGRVFPIVAMVPGGEEAVVAVTGLLERAAAGEFDADTLTQAFGQGEPDPTPEPNAQAQMAWWLGSARDHALDVAGFPTGIDFAHLLIGED